MNECLMMFIRNTTIDHAVSLLPHYTECDYEILGLHKMALLIPPQSQSATAPKSLFLRYYFSKFINLDKIT
jgi:hypothetical protein